MSCTTSVLPRAELSGARGIEIDRVPAEADQSRFGQDVHEACSSTLERRLLFSLASLGRRVSCLCKILAHPGREKPLADGAHLASCASACVPIKYQSRGCSGQRKASAGSLGSGPRTKKLVAPGRQQQREFLCTPSVATLAIWPARLNPS